MSLSHEHTHTLDGAPRAPSVLRLVVISGPDQGQSILLERGTYHVGKDAECSLVLRDAAVSRRHIALELREDGVLVRDLDSKNGSFHNGVRIHEVLLGPGATLRVGNTDLRFVLPDRGAQIPASTATCFGLLLGRSLAMRSLFGVLERVAGSDVSILIEGETGTGKEVCAESIHRASERAAGPLVVCDLGGMSGSLIESELFGHKRGAFTGADRDRDGAFVAAKGGTVFLDEVGELALESQPRLLRALAQRTVKPVGGDRPIPVDVRVLAATNRDLRAEVEAGRFREDLYHRLSVVRVTLPPLRERKEDLPMLVASFLVGRDVALDTDAEALLLQHDWPGNVRELKNVIERALALLGDAREITPTLLGMATPVYDAAEAPASQGSFHETKEQVIARWERAYLADLLKGAGGNVSLAARRSGIDRPYLHRLLKRHRLGEPR